MKHTQQLAQFISQFGNADYAVPAPVYERSEQIIHDAVAVLLAATNPQFSTFKRITEFVKEQGGKPQASVIGAGFRTNTVNAVLANATLGYACDMEPHHPEGILHPVAIMLPTALALGEQLGVDGTTWFNSIILGCEIAYRVSIALGPSEQYDLGFHPSALCGCFAAAAGAAYLLKLDQEAVVRALGLAACQASGMMAWESDASENARPFQMGMAARNGVTAALLAGRGFGGPDAVFDSGHTVFRAFSRNPNPARLTEGLGQRFDGIMELALKPYASVSFLHPALDALLALLNNEKLSAADIEHIVLYFPRSGVHCVDNNPLKSHCAQYVLALAALHGEIWPADLYQDTIDPAVSVLSQRISVCPDEDQLEALFPDFYASVIELKTYSGQVYRQRQDIARGYPENWLSVSEREAKFQRLAQSVAKQERIEQLRSCLYGLRQADDVSVLADLLSEPASLENSR